jgi:hypothetical protein
MNPGESVLGGPAEVAINGITIPASLLSEITVEFTEGTRERTTLGGTFTKPSGVLETAQAMFTMYLPSMDYLKNIFPDRYNAPSGSQTTGNVIFNSDTCTTTEAGPVNIHYTCEATDNNDIHIYSGLAALNFNPTFNESDDLTIEVTIYAQPDGDGNVARMGTGDLTQPSIYDAETEETIPVASS